MRLIDADSITTVNFSGLVNIPPDDFTGLAKYFLEQVKTAPTVCANAAHGYWIDRREDGFFCSVCGGGCLLNRESDYCKSDCCPHCGVKLDMKQSEEESACIQMMNKPYEVPQGKGAW